MKLIYLIIPVISIILFYTPFFYNWSTFEPNECEYGVQLNGFLIWSCEDFEPVKERCLSSFKAFQKPEICNKENLGNYQPTQQVWDILNKGVYNLR